MATKLEQELANYTVDQQEGRFQSLVGINDNKAIVFDIEDNKIVKRFKDGESAWSNAARFASDLSVKHRFSH